MTIEQTLSILKPDALEKNIVGEIYNRYEKIGLKIIAAYMKKLSKNDVEKFYSIHKNRPFFKNLVNFMISGPVFIQVLEGEDAIKKHRILIGDTDPIKAAKGTIRADFAESIDKNIVHGSDSIKNAKFEISYFFSISNIYSKYL
ncbi:nucleoside-diphosphate kinase [Candidatus Profftella armatura]|nr:nucleoside-diphosphate kinase [Candidatus Profftella armatura]ALC96119.1 nucleoside diphosphate kinase [Candidatus Profftella armatura]QLK13695.1 nucleoside-diphosphate kinase [Candidatus Profftella armatura]